MLDHLEWSWRLSVAADYFQTSYLNRSGDGLYELNPYLKGRTDLQNGITFALTSEGVLMVSRCLPKKWREPFLGAMIAHRLYYVFGNHRLGVPGRFHIPLFQVRF